MVETEVSCSPAAVEVTKASVRFTSRSGKSRSGAELLTKAGEEVGKVELVLTRKRSQESSSPRRLAVRVHREPQDPIDAQRNGAMRCHICVADYRQIKGVSHRQHRNVHQELPEDDADVAESHLSSPWEENHGEHKVQEIEEDRSEYVEAVEGSDRALLTALVFNLSVGHVALH